MKRFLMAMAVMGLLSVLSATPGDSHKILWCHFPPGQLGETPDTSKVIVLSIDVAGGPFPSLTPPHHENHQFDGPADEQGNCAGAIG